MLNAKGATNMQKQSFYSSIKAREKAKGHFVARISQVKTLAGIDKIDLSSKVAN